MNHDLTDEDLADDNLNGEVELRRWQHHFDELSGKATPQDHLPAIRARLAAQRELVAEPPAAAVPTSGRRWVLRRPHLVAAALALLGLTATIGVALLRRDSDEQRRDESLAAGVAANAPLDQSVIGSALGAAGAAKAPAAQEPRAPAPLEPTTAPGSSLPKGTDPADLAAMRSAEAMLEAERKLAAQIVAGKLGGVDILPFEALDGWIYQDGLVGMPESVRSLSGKKVVMTGFMLPIDEVENIVEFLLVKSLWSCCYGQPPDIHGIVRVVMPVGQTTDYSFDPIKVVGTFKIEATVMDGYCVDIYQLHAESVETIR